MLVDALGLIAFAFGSVGLCLTLLVGAFVLATVSYLLLPAGQPRPARAGLAMMVALILLGLAFLVMLLVQYLESMSP